MSGSGRRGPAGDLIDGLTEKRVLATMILSREALDFATAHMDPRALTLERGATIFSELKRLAGETEPGVPVDGIELGRRLASVARIELPAALAHLSDLVGPIGGVALPSLALPALESAVDKLNALAGQREAGRAVWRAARAIESGSGSAAALMQAKRALDSLDVERAPTGGPVLMLLADVRPEPVRWLWPARIPSGKLTLLVGDPGLGKSFITLDLAARVTSGSGWPDAPDEYLTPGGVVLLSAEDDVGDTIRPRLDAAGADVSRVVALQAVRRRDAESGETWSVPFTLADALPALETAITETPDCKLVILDPISAYLGGGARFDSHRNTDVRAVLAPLAELGARHKVAVVAVTHLRKGEGPAMYRAMGSLAFVAAARSVWAVARDPDDQSGRRRLLLPVKCNLAVEPTGLGFELRSVSGTAVVAWSAEPVRVSADDALGRDRGRAGTDDGEDAVNFLGEALADGEQPATDVLRQGRANGFTDKAIRKAFLAIGGRRRRSGFGPGGTWFWSLPGSIVAPIDAIDSHALELGNNGNNGATMVGADAGAGDDWGEV